MRDGRRGSGKFREVSWDTALAAVTDGLNRILETSGPAAVLDFGGSGACKGALHNTGRLTSRFLRQLGPVTRLDGNYSFQAAAFVLPYAYGSINPGYDARTLMDTRFVLLWGANVADTRFGNETEAVIRHIRESGGDVIVIDPRRSRTAVEYATEWIPITPGTDAAVMAAVAWVILTENLEDRVFIDTCVHGYDDFVHSILGEHDGIPKTPEWAEAISGVPAATIRRLAINYAAARPAALVPGFSIQRTLGGEEAFRMSVALQAITGNTGRRGGTPGTNMWMGLQGPKISVFPAVPATGGSIPKATWPRAILGGRNGGFPADFKAAYMAGSNYLNQGSDIGAGIAALETLELVVCHELFLTPSATYADIVLPVTHYLEREDVIIPEDNYLYYSARIFDPLFEARNDFDIYQELSFRMGFGDSFTGSLSREEWINRIIDGSSVGREGRENFKATGIFDGGDHERQGLGSFIENPAEHPLDTPSGKIEISSVSYGKTGRPPWPEYQPLNKPENLPLMMVTPHGRLRINSTGSNVEWIRKSEPIRLYMNPADAESRGITEGQQVQVTGETGTMSVPLAITVDIMPGVVSCIQGGWFAGEDDCSVNRVTSLEPTMPSIGTRTHTVFVEVSG
jgi:anaerobic dimethyl sulfoxide reductase subunit A